MSSTPSPCPRRTCSGAIRESLSRRMQQRSPSRALQSRKLSRTSSACGVAKRRSTSWIFPPDTDSLRLRRQRADVVIRQRDPALDRATVAGIRVHPDKSWKSPALESHGTRAGPLEGFGVLFFADAEHEVVLARGAEHVPEQEEAHAAEHLLLGDAFATFQRPSQSFIKHGLPHIVHQNRLPIPSDTAYDAVSCTPLTYW